MFLPESLITFHRNTHSASVLADLADEAGFPPGVSTSCRGSARKWERRWSRIRGCGGSPYTGSPETARHIGAAAARKAAGQYDDAGQVCLAGTCLLVEASVRDPRSWTGCWPAPTNTSSGTAGRGNHDLAGDPSRPPRIHGFVERSRAAGDRVLRGGPIAREGGLWYEPTLIEPCSNDSEIVQNEVFGPVLTLQTFDDETEAVALANGTRYGLSGIVYTGDAARAQRIGRAVRAGTVWVNCFLIRDLTAPFGGCGISGIGREGSDYALDFHSDLKTLQILEGSTAWTGSRRAEPDRARPSGRRRRLRPRPPQRPRDAADPGWANSQRNRAGD